MSVVIGYHLIVIVISFPLFKILCGHWWCFISGCGNHAHCTHSIL